MQQFRPTPSGRIRSKAPPWRTYHSRVKLSATVIQVQARQGQHERFLEKLRADETERHTFTGSIARYILGDAETIQIMLIWKDTEMPDEATQQRDLLAFQRAFADVLDWDTARICTKDVFLHT